MVDDFAWENLLVAALWQDAAKDREPPLITPDRVLAKDHMGVGFFTTLRSAPDLRLAPDDRSGALDHNYNVLTREGQISGSVFFLKDGVLKMIEAYTFAGALLEDDSALRLATEDDWIAWRARKWAK